MRNKFWNKDHEKNFQYVRDLFRDRRGLSKGRPDFKFLEIGTYEGRTAWWLCEHVLFSSPGSYITCVDPLLKPEFQRVMKKHLRAHRAYWCKIKSRDFLAQAMDKGEKFDFIYVDGDHHASSVLQDLVLSWSLLKKGGMLLIDDYEMEARDPWFYRSHPEFRENPRLNFIHPRTAIDAFLSAYRGQYDKVIDNYQVGLIKTCEISG